MSVPNDNQPEIVPPVEVTESPVEVRAEWADILDGLPDEFVSQLTPKLKVWDQNVGEKIRSVHAQYEPYKPLIEGQADPLRLQQAQALVEQLEADPNSVVANMIEHFGLDFVNKAALEALAVEDPSSEDYGLDDEDDDKLLNHPLISQMKQTLDAIAEKEAEKAENERKTQAQTTFEQTLTQLETDHGAFDKMYVTALMSQGVNGAEAVKQYHDTVNQAAAKLAGQQVQTTTPPPVVMGGDGNTGSGIPDNAVRLGDLSNNDTTALVKQMIEAANAQTT